MVEKFILWFDEIGVNDVPCVGGKSKDLTNKYQKTGASVLKNS
jgi:phosphoenolpyruvate synthase/pyruvate phosphate dikinase